MSEEKAPSQLKPELPTNGKPTNGHEINKILFWFCLFWNVVYLVGSVLSFIRDDYYMPRAATVIYLSLVGSYTLHNEINRWNGRLLTTSRPGQIIFFGWLTMALGMLTTQFITKDKYKFSQEMLEFCLGLIAIFVGNEISKIVRQRNGNGNGNGKK